MAPRRSTTATLLILAPAFAALLLAVFLTRSDTGFVMATRGMLPLSRLSRAIKLYPTSAPLKPIASSISTSIPSTSRNPLSSTRTFATSATMASQQSFLDVVKARRTYYQLNNKAPIDDDKIIDIVKQAVLHVPSSFNSQSSRVVVLLKAEHEKFWDIVKEVLHPQVTEEQWKGTEAKLNGFRGAYGTIMFLEDPRPVHDLQKAFPLYSHHFPTWSEHTSAMHQYALWCALEAEGFGANLQHYNPVIDQKVKNQWNIPQEWELTAQLVIGGRAGEPGEKEFKPLEERLFVHGK